MKKIKRTERIEVALDAARKERRESPGIDKRATVLKTAAPADSEQLGNSGLYRPTDEQLAKINEFTRSPKTADDVVVFNTLSCNNLFDRDDDAFTTDTVKGFSKLPDPYGPVGKSYMVSHDYTQLPVGRIFETGGQKVTDAVGETAESGVDPYFMTNGVYMPNTDQYKNFIENIDFGLYWAVSVGVMLESMRCSISWCGAEMYSSRFFGSWCMNGHDKGYYYTEDAEDDGWGYLEPVDPATKGAQKCRGLMDGAKDFYELSQCFLGAQFYAGLDKVASATKSVGQGKMINLSAAEAEQLPLRHIDERAHKAITGGHVAHRDADGSLRWSDPQGLIWTYQPGGEVLCLGKASDTDEDDSDDNVGDQEGDEDGEFDSGNVEGRQGGERESDDEPLGEHEGEQPESTGGSGDAEVGEDGSSDASEEQAGSDGDLTELSARLTAVRGKVVTYRSLVTEATGDGTETDEDQDPVALAEALDAVLDEIQEAIDAEDLEQADNLLTSAETTVDELIAVLGGTDEDDTGTQDSADKEAELSKKAVLAAATKARVPATVLSKVNAAEGNGLDVLLREISGTNATLASEVSALRPKAVLGDKFIEEKHAEAVAWYVKAHQEGDASVNVDSFTKLLTACGDDTDLISDLIAEQKNLAQAKFPKSTRRSTAPQDPNTSEGPGEISDVPGDESTTRRVRRLHG